MGTLLVGRHGECVANTKGIVAGAGDDSPLTEKGLLDAEAVSPKLMGRQVMRIISSPLQRAVRTAEVIRDADFPGMEITIDEHFSERHVGAATGMKLEEYFALEKSGDTIDGAETAAEMFDRVEEGLAGLHELEGTTLLITHNGTYRMIECVLQNRPPEDFADIPGLHNGEIRELDI